MCSGPDAFRQFAHEGWKRVASKYEEAWSGLTRSFIPSLLEAVEVTTETSLLDVACGPGYVAEAARALGAEPMGVDFSSEMIHLARERSPKIGFHVGDAQALGFRDDAFDAVVMNFAVSHLSNPKAAFAEASRVLRSGGRYGFTVWARPELSPGSEIVQKAVLAHASMDAPLPEGPDFFVYGDPNECKKTLGGLGFDPASLVFRTVTAEWLVPTDSFVFESERDAGIRLAALFAAQTPETLSAILAQIKESVRAYARADGFAIPYTAHVVAVTAI